MEHGDGYTVGELARTIQSALVRMESLATRLEGGQFVNSESFRLNNEKIDLQLQGIREDLKNIATAEQLKNLRHEVESLKSDRTWLVRLLVGFVVLGVLGIWVAAGGVAGQ